MTGQGLYYRLVVYHNDGVSDLETGAYERGRSRMAPVTKGRDGRLSRCFRYCSAPPVFRAKRTDAARAVRGHRGHVTRRESLPVDCTWHDDIDDRRQGARAPGLQLGSYSSGRAIPSLTLPCLNRISPVSRTTR